MSAWISCPVGYAPYVTSEADLINAKNPATGLPLTDAEKQGFACRNGNGIYLHQMSDPQIAAMSAKLDQDQNTAKITMAAAIVALLVLPGAWKLIALPLTIISIKKSLTGLAL